jgi:SAM-dependent methyltransferase
MSVFGRYADWYDLFYADKDYRAEAAFVDRTLRAHGAAGGTLLEIGCGTGAHARWLVTLGWRLCGIDRSEDMLAQARQRFARLAPGQSQDAEFRHGDARGFELGRRFDAAVSLFHVMSYQAEAGELEAALRAARRHLRAGGLFLFDFWFGPAVLAQKPEARKRTVESENYRVTRTAVPTVHEDRRVVDVAYHFEVVDTASGGRQELDELHRMRYLFPDEIHDLAGAAGFRVESVMEWLTGIAPGEHSWNACAVLRADDGRH